MNSRVESGTFHCPRCGTDKPFEIISVKRWFTLYFIPVIPMGEAGRYLECRNCSGTFDEAVRDRDPEVENSRIQESFQEAILRAMLIMAQAEGEVDHDQLDMIAEIMTRISGRGFEVEEVQATLEDGTDPSLESVLTGVAGALSADGKTMIMKALMRIASADGPVSAPEAEILYEAGKWLGLRRKDVQAALTPRKA